MEQQTDTVVACIGATLLFCIAGGSFYVFLKDVCKLRRTSTLTDNGGNGSLLENEDAQTIV